jgi:hypothetical protein
MIFQNLEKKNLILPLNLTLVAILFIEHCSTAAEGLQFQLPTHSWVCRIYKVLLNFFFIFFIIIIYLFIYIYLICSLSSLDNT